MRLYWVPLVRQCQQALNDISTRHAVRLYWVPLHAGVRGNEITNKLARSGSVQWFVGPQPFLGVSRQYIRRNMKRSMEKQNLVLWRGPCSIQRQARELISGPNLAAGVRLLSFNPLNPKLNPICYLLALLGAHHFLHVSRIRVKLLTFRLVMSYIYIYIYIYMEHPFLMFLDHTQRRSTVGRTPLDE